MLIDVVCILAVGLFQCVDIVVKSGGRMVEVGVLGRGVVPGWSFEVPFPSPVTWRGSRGSCTAPDKGQLNNDRGFGLAVGHQPGLHPLTSTVVLINKPPSVAEVKLSLFFSLFSPGTLR